MPPTVLPCLNLMLCIPIEPFMARYGHNETWLHLVRLHDATQTKCLMRCHRGFNCGFARADSSCSLKSSPVFEPQWFYKKLTTDNWYLVNTQTGVGKYKFLASDAIAVVTVGTEEPGNR